MHLKVFDSHTKMIGSMYYFCIIAQEYEKLAQNSTATQGKKEARNFCSLNPFQLLSFPFFPLLFFSSLKPVSVGAAFTETTFIALYTSRRCIEGPLPMCLVYELHGRNCTIEQPISHTSFHSTLKVHTRAIQTYLSLKVSD